MNKSDLRVIKTKKMLYNTLMELMKEKAFEEIKVCDICDKALINRSTFYAHYNDKYELLADTINNIKNTLTAELKKNTHILYTKEYYMEMIRLFLDYIEEKRDLYISIMVNNRNSITMDILYDVLDNDIKSNLKENSGDNKNIVPNDIVAKFYLGAVFNIGIEWVKNINLYTKEEIIQYLNCLIPNDLYN